MATTERNAGDPIRARAPHVLSVYQETREAVLEGGIVERELKDLCARYLAEDPDAIARGFDGRAPSLTGRL
jgi:hypothetical protein